MTTETFKGGTVADDVLREAEPPYPGMAVFYGWVEDDGEPYPLYIILGGPRHGDFVNSAELSALKARILSFTPCLDIWRANRTAFVYIAGILEAIYRQKER